MISDKARGYLKWLLGFSAVLIVLDIVVAGALLLGAYFYYN